MDAVQIITSIDIPQNRIEDLLCCAFEGGSDYWAKTGVTAEQKKEVGAEYAFEVATRGGEVEVFDVENGELLGVLNGQSIVNAFTLMSQGEDKNGKAMPCLKRYLQTFLKEDEDSEVGDVFLQMAVMGEIVFG